LIRLAHVCSSDLAIPALMPFNEPLLARGWEVTMITPDGPHVAAGQKAGLVWRPFALRRTLHAPSDLAGSLQLARYCRAHRYDIVHTHNIKAGHIGRVVAAAMRVPIVVHTIHGMPFSLETPPLKRAAHAALERIANLGCDAVMSQAVEDMQSCIATHAVRPERISLIGNGINLLRFDPRSPLARRDEVRAELGIAPDDVLFVTAGRLIVEKGFVELFEALALARAEEPRVQLAVAGAVDERSDALGPEVLERARHAGAKLLGRREDMVGLYAASDVVTLPSWHEGVPRVLMEGAAMGKPLLATDVRGCREVIRNPDEGVLVPVRDAPALARAMVALTRAPLRREELGRGNLARARHDFAVETSVAKVLAVYDRLLAERGLA
jgi:glycosyltransferase involved in cell wall biosynthesis